MDDRASGRRAAGLGLFNNDAEAAAIQDALSLKAMVEQQLSR
ncbi:hypothetical protein U1769_11990 [Sphingomonas sp. ZT3P38]